MSDETVMMPVYQVELKDVDPKLKSELQEKGVV
jgi:hypothetical protein